MKTEELDQLYEKDYISHDLIVWNETLDGFRLISTKSQKPFLLDFLLYRGKHIIDLSLSVSTGRIYWKVKEFEDDLPSDILKISVGDYDTDVGFIHCLGGFYRKDMMKSGSHNHRVKDIIDVADSHYDFFGKMRCEIDTHGVLKIKDKSTPLFAIRRCFVVGPHTYLAVQ